MLPREGEEVPDPSYKLAGMGDYLDQLGQVQDTPVGGAFCGKKGEQVRVGTLKV